MHNHIALSLAALSAAFAAPSAHAALASATVTATFTTLSGGRMYWLNDLPVNLGSGGSIFTTTVAVPASPIAVAIPVTFSFTTPGALAAAVTNVPALFTLKGTAVASPAIYPGTNVLQKNIDNGYYSFVSTTPTLFGGQVFAPGTPLLYGKFGSARIIGTLGGTAAKLYDTSSFGTLSMFSFLTPISGPSYSFVIYKFGLSPVLTATPGKALYDFDPEASGSFTAGVPEPAAWALMIAGFAMVGAAQRQRSGSAATA